MIPEFTEAGLLPPGIHPATRDNFESRFVIVDRSDRRFRIYDDLKRLLDDVSRSIFVKRILIAGSFVTSQPEPNDFDCLLILDQSISGDKLVPSDYNLVSRKSARRIYKGDVVPVIEGTLAMREYLDFFQTTRDGQPMGIVELVE